MEQEKNSVCLEEAEPTKDWYKDEIKRLSREVFLKDRTIEALEYALYMLIPKDDRKR